MDEMNLLLIEQPLSNDDIFQHAKLQNQLREISLATGLRIESADTRVFTDEDAEIFRAFVAGSALLGLAPTKRFARTNEDLTETSLKAGRLMAFMFPTVIVILNLSNAAVLWIGANRISAGSLKPGVMNALLS